LHCCKQKVHSILLSASPDETHPSGYDSGNGAVQGGYKAETQKTQGGYRAETQKTQGGYTEAESQKTRGAYTTGETEKAPGVYTTETLSKINKGGGGTFKTRAVVQDIEQTLVPLPFSYQGLWGLSSGAIPSAIPAPQPAP
jgi:hypothetical protein